MEVTIDNIFDLRMVVEQVFGQGSFIESLERRGLYKSRIASVIDTDWDATSTQLIAYHWTVDAEPVVEKFNFPPTWSNKESWKSIFNTDYPDCPEDALDIALWTARTPSKIVLEDENGVRTISSVITDVITKKPKKPIVIKPKTKRKFVNDSPILFKDE